MASSADVNTAFTEVLRRSAASSDHTHYAVWSKAAMIEDVIATTENRDYVKPVIRLYQSVLGRKPDTAGLTFWVGQFKTSMSLSAIAGGFLASIEGQMRFPDSDANIVFVGKLYSEIFGRTGDPAGVGHFKNLLDTNAWSRPQMLAHFSEETESKDRLASPIYSFQIAIAGGDNTAYTGSFV